MITQPDSNSGPGSDPEVQPLLQLMVADSDPVFRLGLKVWLEQHPNFQVVAEVSSPPDLLNLLDPFDVPPFPQPLDLVILDFMDVPTSPDAGAALCQQLKSKCPSLPLLVLSSQIELTSLLLLWQAGVEGCWLKGTNPTELVPLLPRLATGEQVWHSQLRAQLQAAFEQRSSESTLISQRYGPFDILKNNLRKTSLQEIEEGLSQLQSLLQQPQLPWWQQVVLEGQCREIQTVKALVERLLPAPSVETGTDNRPLVSANQSFSSANGVLSRSPTATLVGTEETTGFDQLVPEEKFRAIKSLLLDTVLAKLPTSLLNQTHETLEIDILKAEKKQTLFYSILRRFEEVLDELRFSQVQRSQLVHKESQILVDLWKATTADFVGKYLTLPLTHSAASPTHETVEIFTVLLQEQATVQAEILDKIPQVVELLDHLLFQTPLVVDNSVCAVGSPEAVLQAEALLENLVVQVANAVVQPLLNRFATTEVIKQNFYDRRLISTREIERFRNALSWKYRLHRFILEPKYIFESRISLFVFSEAGLKKASIYTAREHEFKELSGVQLAVTLILETRDAIAPPLQSTVKFVGRGVVYLLTQVVGRGIGLIGRGILQGIGNAWNDLSLSQKNSSQGK